jgi:hypothetical protein
MAMLSFIVGAAMGFTALAHSKSDDERLVIWRKLIAESACKNV